MKPCLSKRKLLAWLALGELDASRAQALRAHLQTCHGCRRYLREMSTVSQSLAAQQAEPEIEASASFHRTLLRRIRTEPAASPWQALATRVGWRLALPAIGAAALVVAILFLVPRPPVFAPPEQTSLPTVKSPAPARDLSPTIANYQLAAMRSLDELDDLLTRQARRNLPPAPIYTASIFALADTLD